MKLPPCSATYTAATALGGEADGVGVLVAEGVRALLGVGVAVLLVLNHGVAVPLGAGDAVTLATTGKGVAEAEAFLASKCCSRRGAVGEASGVCPLGCGVGEALA